MSLKKPLDPLPNAGRSCKTIAAPKYRKSLLDVLLPKTRSSLLHQLLISSGRGLHLRELERRTGLDKTGLLRELRSLANSGIILSERSGNRVYYRANERCPIYPELRVLIMKTVGLADELRETLKPFAERIVLAYIYGSFATGDVKAESDVDLMVVGEVKLRELATPLAQAERRLMREVNVTSYTVAEYRKRLRGKNGFVRRVHKAPKIALYGDADELE